MKQHQTSAANIQNRAKNNPTKGLQVINHNQPYVFLRKIPNLALNQGPPEAMSKPLTSFRSFAVHPDLHLWADRFELISLGKDPMKRLMIAQDTGPERADIFMGSGVSAGKKALKNQRHGVAFYTFIS